MRIRVLACALTCALLSCGGRREVEFPVAGIGAALRGLDGGAASGRLDLSGGKSYRYRFDRGIVIPPEKSLELAYTFAGDAAGAGAALRFEEGGAWELPGESPFTGGGGEALLYYAVPLDAPVLHGFSIVPAADGAGGKKENRGFLELRSLKVVPRYYGFARQGDGVSLSPFVYAGEDAAMVIDPPPAYRTEGPADILIRAAGAAAVEAGNRRFEGAGNFLVPGAALSAAYRPSACRPSAYRPVTVQGDGVGAAILTPASPPPFPEPLAADPGIVLEYPQENWRDRRFEIFRWEDFPSVLVFDTADYAVQDRLFKRLAFFTEKKGFRGRLAADSEIAALHGWNAHDYRPEDLARFYNTAAAENFPLLAEERELENILLRCGVLLRDGGGLRPGAGAVISVSRQSAGYLRTLFMIHEGFHGLFFTDDAFRDFSRRRWEGLSATAKRFILSYFDFQGYDVEDEYLVINEFMAHVLQQPVSQAARYFGETLSSRIDESPWRRAVLPEREGNSWPAIGGAFRREAAAFSGYAAERWNLAAGRVWKVTVREIPPAE
ncbi:MAG: hypothetical protein LBS06_02515 [Treponema sp.]|jgi:hypothetical protein|nr:hypothetical protein [Treponema sp.]